MHQAFCYTLEANFTVSLFPSSDLVHLSQYFAVSQKHIHWIETGNNLMSGKDDSTVCKLSVDQ